MPPHRVRYNPLLAVFLALPTAYVSATAVVLAVETGALHRLAVAAILAALTARLAVGARVEVGEGAVRERNLYGLVVREHRIGSLGDLAVEGALLVRREGGEVLVRGGFPARSGDWEALRAALGAPPQPVGAQPPSRSRSSES
ncbi:MAG: hypothetical protein JXX28_12170 [Deltaproteobacteria bacterium]|nr:hypothetical protein [Deltaproteobacteria bacterium]